MRMSLWSFNGVYSRDNLPNKIKDGAYVINFDEYPNPLNCFVCIQKQPTSGVPR